MTTDSECQNCYEKILAKVRQCCEERCRDGESLEASVYGRYGDGNCYLNITYHTIRNRKHISQSERLSMDIAKPAVFKLFPGILDNLLEQWRGVEQR